MIVSSISYASTINEIRVVGNKHVPTPAILSKIPYHVGEVFNPNKTQKLINNLYFDLGRFRYIAVKKEPLGDNRINLYIIVEEKIPLKDVLITGNTQVTNKEIREKLLFDDIPAIDEQECKRFAQQINNIYIEKGYHRTKIDYHIQVDEQGNATLHFEVHEEPQSLVKRIFFEGNDNISSKSLRNIIFTREDWIGGFLDKAGTYMPDRLETDKYIIEQYYQNHGYLNAKVTNVEVIRDETTDNFTIIFDIQEGDQYHISEVTAQGHDQIPEEQLVLSLPIQTGDVYSREKIVEVIKFLEYIWGERGYLFVHVEPSIIPDDATKTVKLGFTTELGKPVFLRRINIRGNQKTRDKVIRRNISLVEGALITNSQMERSKNRIASLGYFEQQDGVNWKTTRIDENTADLDLVLREAKTGNASIQLNFGGSEQAINDIVSGLAAEVNIADRNLFGTGIAVNLLGKLSKEEKTILFNITQPWMFDQPIYASMDVYHKRIGYDEFVFTQPVNEQHTGASFTSGFVTGVREYEFFNDTFFRFTLGLDRISYERIPTAIVMGLPRGQQILATQEYNAVLRKLFEPGSFFWFTTQIGQNKRNHPMHTSQGHAWTIQSQIGFPSLDNNIGFHKLDIDAHWFTPLINEYSLIFHLHGYMGWILRFKNRVVPYRELFHIGGPGSVRGYLFGQIGPQFDPIGPRGDSIGGQKALFMNAELMFPILQDYSMKAVLFYDGGSGWDAPYSSDLSPQFLKNNSFSYRHAVGVGIRLLRPMPLRIDWGFKLDPRKGESSHEVHFNMSYDW